MGDIRKIPADKVHDEIKRNGITNITLLTGGFPCQDFSIANRKYSDNDERNFLFLEHMKYVLEFIPDFIILENISGLWYTGAFKKYYKVYGIAWICR